MYLIWEVNLKHRGLNMINKNRGFMVLKKITYVEIYRSKYSTVILWETGCPIKIYIPH